MHCCLYFIIIDTSHEEDSETSLASSTDESMGTNLNVTKQFKLREKRIEVKDNVTKKIVLDSVQIRTPKRRRIVRKHEDGNQAVASAGDDTNSASTSKMVCNVFF